MKVVSNGYGKYQCPYCNTVVELEKGDVRRWWSVYYYICPTCHKTPHISHGRIDNWLCPYDIEGKKAIKL